MDNMPGIWIVLAEAFRYPAPGRLETLEEGLRSLPSGKENGLVDSFLSHVRQLSLGAWEELYTRTLDLNPPLAPYVGFQTWGESYQRGEFLSKMNGVLMRAGIDTDGELPDHLVPVFRYLALSHDPLPELVEVLEPAFQRMAAALRNADTNNPYLFLLEAAQASIKQLPRQLKEPV